MLLRPPHDREATAAEAVAAHQEEREVPVICRIGLRAAINIHFRKQMSQCIMYTPTIDNRVYSIPLIKLSDNAFFISELG